MARLALLDPKKAPLWLKVLFWRQERRYGFVLEPLRLWGRRPVLLRRFLAFFAALNRPGSPIDPALRALVSVRVSQACSCSFCVDLNSSYFMDRAAEPLQLERLGAYETDPLFSERERAALRYAEEMSRGGGAVSDATFARLSRAFGGGTKGEDAILELTALVAFQNLSCRFNTALGVPAQGICRLPSAGQPAPKPLR